jgi:DNA mismatch repair ATPase MutS
LTVETASEFVALDPASSQPGNHRDIVGRCRTDAVLVLDGCRGRQPTVRVWLTQPLQSQAKASARHDATDALRADGPVARALVAGLRKTIDVERVVGRIACATRGRDLAGRRDTLARLPDYAPPQRSSKRAAAARRRRLAVDAQWAALLTQAIAPVQRRWCATAV